jgi:hypothetical protein
MLCQLDAASLHAQYRARLHGVLDELGVVGYLVTSEMKCAHAIMVARYNQLFQLVRFDEHQPGKMEKYVLHFEK